MGTRHTLLESDRFSEPSILPGDGMLLIPAMLTHLLIVKQLQCHTSAATNTQVKQE